MSPIKGPREGPECTATRLIMGMVVRLSHAGQTAATSRSAMLRSRSKVVAQSLQRYS